MIKNPLFLFLAALLILLATFETQAKSNALTFESEITVTETSKVEVAKYSSPLAALFEIELKNGLMQNGSTADRQYHGSFQEVATFEVWKDGVKVGTYISDLFEQNGGIETYIEKIKFQDGRSIFTIANVKDGTVLNLNGNLHENGKVVRKIKTK